MIVEKNILKWQSVYVQEFRILLFLDFYKITLSIRDKKWLNLVIEYILSLSSEQ